MPGDIITTLVEMQSKLDVHIAAETERGKKVDEMYKVLVVGNGVPSIKSRVNRLEEQMLDKDTVKELELKIDQLEERLPSVQEWSKIKLWSDISMWTVGLAAAAWISAQAPKILSWLASL